jgi:hypothetical protein
MHPARHRALRELAAFSRQLADHWDSLAGRLGDAPAAKPLLAGAGAARELVGEVQRLSAARDLVVGRLAIGVAGRTARARPPVPDAVLEVNQALRFALLDAEHVVTLCEYVGALSAAEADPELVSATAAWAAAIRAPARAVRRAAIALGKDPDRAIAPLSPGHRLNYAIGWFGEATDRATTRRSRR